MRKRRPHIASLDELRITRDGDAAVIEYADERVATTHFTLGTQIHRMSDEEILERWNECLEARDASMAEYEHVAIEIPPGKPQIRYFDKGMHWTPRGAVLRCVIDDGGPDGEPVVHIDERELSWQEFGQVLTCFAGWGMRIIFVPDDELHEEPCIEVREPEDE